MLGGIRRIVCGISGGVDSAVSAYLLKRKGYEVVGLFMRNWDISDEKGQCSVDGDKEDAQYVCNILNIPLYEVNFVKQYWNEVFSDMVKDYESGVTPNPDILCNRHIKFNYFMKHALSKFAADAVATGHYARTSVGFHLDRIDPDVGVSLMQAKDKFKDQTFFLSQIPQWALQKTIFPLGNLEKTKVKQIATEAGLDKIAKKKESMGVCFIGKRNFHDFIEEYIEPKPGNFIDVETGAVLGTHRGTHKWTLGQRSLIRGKSVAYFVVELRPKTREVVVAPGTDHPSLFRQTFETDEVTWIQKKPPVDSQNINEGLFRFQHVHPLASCSWSQLETGGSRVMLDMPLRALTAGQYAVFYQDDVCLGSGRISKLGKTLFEMDIKERVQFPKEFS